MTQEEAFEILVSGKNVLITGQAGTGKTFLLNKYIEYLNNKKIPVGITASTGIAATHLGGITIHSWSGMGIKDSITSADIKRIFRSKSTLKRIQEAEVLIIDEISMLHGFQLDLVDQICSKVRIGFGPFGGLQVVLCGDFFQLPPVSQIRGEGDFVDQAKVWEAMDLRICYLDKQFRQTENNKLHKLLNEVRENNLSEDSINSLTKRINSGFPDGVIPTKLFTHNSSVDTYNLNRLNMIPASSRNFMMDKTGDEYFVNQMVKGCMAPENLELKVGAVVMFVFNNFAKGYVNGTTGVISGFDVDTGYPIVQTFKGDEIIAAPIRWAYEESPEIEAWIAQVPLRLAWAITIHKSQGMTLDYAEIDLSRAFTHGLGYVALSRVSDLDGLNLLGINDIALKVSEKAIELDKSLRAMSN